MFKKVNRSLKYDSNIFLSSNIYMDTNTDHYTLLVLRVRGNNCITRKMVPIKKRASSFPIILCHPA